MTIRSIDTIALNLPFSIDGPTPLFAGKPRLMEILLVKVETTEGVVGWGEAFGYGVWPATREAIRHLVAPLATGRDERDIGALMGDLARKLHILGRGGAVTYALSGLDIALWDIAGKVAGQPLHALIGGAKHTRLPCYASLMRYTDPALVAKNAAAAVARGFPAIKLHEIGAAQVKAARDAIGPGVPLMMDVNCPWSVDEALAIAREVKPYDLHWFEEPVWPPEDFRGLAAVRAACGMPVTAGENAISAKNFEQMFEAGAVDVAQPSVTKIGGVSAMLDVLRLARAHGVRVVPHCPYFGPGLLASMHLIATMAEPTWVEYSYADLGANPLGDAILPVAGHLAVPQGPGLGRDPDPEVLRRYAA